MSILIYDKGHIVMLLKLGGFVKILNCAFKKN